jgi:hypothetical protein
VLSEGNILYFTPFYFPNGNTAKSKYFVVLKVIGEESVLASLPTRKNSIPLKEEIEHGCIELPDINLNCFVISNKICVTDCNKKFYFTTYIYGHQLNKHKSALLKEIYQLEGTDYIVWGKMKEEIFKKLIECLAFADTVNRKYQRLLRR